MLLNIIDGSNKTYGTITNEIEKIHHELESYDEKLVKKDLWIVINKIDLISNEELADLRKMFSKTKLDVYFVSTITKIGIKELTDNIYEFLKYENRIK